MKLQSMNIVALFAVACGSATLNAHMPAARPDNSRQNAHLLTEARSAASPSAVTADDQPNDRADRIIAARVRRVIVTDDTLSIYAHNVKVIVDHGTVTLAGPVHSNQERLEIAADTATVVSPGSIVDRISVA